MPNNSSKAFSVIELLLVISLVSIMLVSAIRYYQEKKFEVELNALQHNVEQLGQWLNLYYYLECRKNPPFPTPGGIVYNREVTLLQLIKAGVSPVNSLVYVPWAHYSMRISLDSPADSDYHLWVIAKINKSQETISYLKGRLNAIAAPDGDSTAIAWMRLPSQKVASMDTADWIMGAGLQEFNKYYRIGGKSTPCAY